MPTVCAPWPGKRKATLATHEPPAERGPWNGSILARGDGAGLQLLDDQLVEPGGRVPGQLVALLLLRADVQEADPRPVVLEDVPGEDGAHDAVLEQVLGLGVDVGADVEEDGAAMQRRHDRGDAGPAHALEE